MTKEQWDQLVPGDEIIRNNEGDIPNKRQHEGAIFKITGKSGAGPNAYDGELTFKPVTCTGLMPVGVFCFVENYTAWDKL